MNVGLPGTGIGGLFYLLTALIMPIVELGNTLLGRSTLDRWKLVLRQVILASGVVLGLMATGWLLNHALPKHATVSLHTVNKQATHVLGVTPTKLTVVMLVGVLLAVEALRSVLSVFRSLQRLLSLPHERFS